MVDITGNIKIIFKIIPANLHYRIFPGYVTDPNDFKEKTAVDFSVIFFEKSTAALFPMLMPEVVNLFWTRRG